MGRNHAFGQRPECGNEQYLIVERLERLLTDVQRQKSKVIQQLADLRRMSNSGKNELVDDWVAAVEAADTEAEDVDDGTETT